MDCPLGLGTDGPGWRSDAGLWAVGRLRMVCGGVCLQSPVRVAVRDVFGCEFLQGETE